jgi:hypothetical protein
VRSFQNHVENGCIETIHCADISIGTLETCAESISIVVQASQGKALENHWLKGQFDDPSLFRQQAYVNGQWIDAKDGKTFDVTGRILRWI